MKDLIIPVNNEALSRALIAIAGEEKTVVILEAYRLIDAAMIFGYQKGLNEGAEDRATAAKEYVEAIDRDGDAAYDHGFMEGHSQSAAESYDDGYVDGVSDARSFPDFADDQVALLCADAEYYEGDSGDENDFEDDGDYKFDIESGKYVPAID